MYLQIIFGQMISFLSIIVQCYSFCQFGCLFILPLKPLQMIERKFRLRLSHMQQVPNSSIKMFRSSGLLSISQRYIPYEFRRFFLFETLYFPHCYPAIGHDPTSPPFYFQRSLIYFMLVKSAIFCSRATFALVDFSRRALNAQFL